MVEYRGNKIALTEKGRGYAKSSDEVLAPDELQQKVLEILPGPEKKLLNILLESYPESITNEDLAIRSGYAPNGGAYNNPRGRLRSLGLIEYAAGQVKAKPLLFLE